MGIKVTHNYREGLIKKAIRKNYTKGMELKELWQKWDCASKENDIYYMHYFDRKIDRLEKELSAA